MYFMRRAFGTSLLAIFIPACLILASAARAQKVVPVVDIGGGGCVMGGAAGGKWLKAEDIAPLMKGNERYNVYSPTRRVGMRNGGKPVSEGPPCSDTMYVKNMAPKRTDAGLIAIGGSWNALPRVPKVESTRSTVYRAAVAELLRQKGIRNPQVRLVKVLRVDLEGDGVDEVLINATRAKRWESGIIANDSDAGDYSVVMLRKVIGGKVETIVLDGEYHPKPRDPETEGPPNEYELAAVLDLNGDGRMEVITAGAYYEGSWKTVYAIDGRKVENLFGCGCGA